MLFQRFYRVIVVAIAMFLVIGCKPEVQSKNELLKELFFASPIDDAKADISEGEIQFIAVHNHKLIMPLEIPECLVEDYGYKILSNENFKYMGYEYQQYGSLSMLYANWYNYTVHEYLENLGNTCIDESNQG